MLKSIFHLFKSAESVNGENINSPELQTKKLIDLVEIFDPRGRIEDLAYDGSTDDSSLVAKLADGNILTTVFNVQLGTKSIQMTKQIDKNAIPIFIPCNELMYFVPELSSVAKEYVSLVDLTFRELLESLPKPIRVLGQLSETAKSILYNIERQIGGKFFVAQDGSMFFSNEGWADKTVVRRANLIAEGYRKFGILARLLESRTIAPGESGPLLWDEPETNLNPSMMEPFANIALELSRNGQQVIFTTHSNEIAKWLDILKENARSDDVKFHNFLREDNVSELNVLTTENYDDIDRNSIDDAISTLSDFEMKKQVENFNNKMENDNDLNKSRWLSAKV